jgi:1-acyl-sn-glycerol-3-phosphate acyltransferase
MREQPLIMPTPNWRVRLLRGIVNGLFSLCTRRTVSGLENIPTTGACLFVFNHVSNFDPPLLFTYIHRPDATGLVAADYRPNRFYRFVVETAGGMWIRRNARDREAIQRALSLLESGWLVGVAPEGRRSPNRALIEGKQGPAWLALKANAPVLPVGVTNTWRIGQSFWRLQRPAITVAIGKPFRLPPRDGRRSKEHLGECTDLIMCQIAALLPPEYRGVYTTHPRLEPTLRDQSGLEIRGDVAVPSAANGP